jgi:murein DD-endopeptidase MepM/ murein hydrolase activator NlpD
LFPPPAPAREEPETTAAVTAPAVTIPVMAKPGGIETDITSHTPDKPSAKRPAITETKITIPSIDRAIENRSKDEGETSKDAGTAVSDPIEKQFEPVEKQSKAVEKNSKSKLKVSWNWPLKGVIAKNYSQTGRKGLEIMGKYGAPVLAAADGRIVYCGQGLIGYGNLVIVKHDAHFLSAYGHNSRLLVREGDYVKRGQRIAEVGMGTDKQPVLHFEIRKDGKPVNPTQHLPKP